MPGEPVSEDSVKLLPTIERSLYERPGLGFWFAVVFLTLLVGGSFLLTMVFVTAGPVGFGTVGAGFTLGLVPGTAFGLIALGFTYAVYPPYSLRVLLTVLFLMVVPALLIGFAVGLRNPWVYGLAVPGVLLGWCLARFGIWVYRRAGWGSLRAPAGSWEEHF